MRTDFRLAIPMTLLLAACGEDPPVTEVPEVAEDLSFPEGFLFGTAIGGFQAEMGCPTPGLAGCVDDGSDWYAFATSPETVHSTMTYLSGQDPAVVGPGFWELHEQDLDRARGELHNGAFRFSIEWSRIFPDPTDGIEGYEALRAVANEAALAHYHAMLNGLRVRGMSPIVTLNHGTLPAWIHDAVGCHLNLAACKPRGWLDRERTVEEIAKYAGFVAREFGADVDRWATLDEPFAVLLSGYLAPSAERSHPPAVALASGAVKEVFVALVEAHARMYDAVKESDVADADGDGNPSDIGLVYAMTPASPADPTSELDVKSAENMFYLYNVAYLDAVAKGELDEELAGKSARRADLEGRMDWLGINYDARATVRGMSGPFMPDLTPLGTFDPLEVRRGEVDPEGLHEMLALAYREYGLPLYVTGNGLDHPLDDEDAGPSFLVRHLAWANRAMQEGVDLRGYFFWSLVDDYEWNQGMNRRFGLYAVDASDPQKNRTPRKTAETYGIIAEERRIPPELLVAFPAPR
ncbi:glycoside hydrolase family 1 protein [Polyangium jinanense]|uniref:Glycoside hydrolase family 1 protein n=1 Tax=Polyangium jinanense TaxID=2829994 RepID=A0A9X4AV30_9BACT|nr:glycoside hydrolase family 1 protein [Polyangium jinanense]MDC3960769.1 glycoside hydrolase family 1 protein [Polyangium jinanense]MDC3985853.1 glycoside hydrolase family 1 protein [Polyangium jinanense]